MVTCFLKYVIDPYKLDEFESYARAWIPIVNRMGEVITVITCLTRERTIWPMLFLVFPDLRHMKRTVKK